MQHIEFELNREFVQLNQLLKLTGLADSGGAGKAMVAGGGVLVDGNEESRKTCKIRVGQVVTVFYVFKRDVSLLLERIEIIKI